MGGPEAPGPSLGAAHTQPHPRTEAGCPPGRLYRECQQGEGCPYSCAHLAGRIACFPGGCQEGCHCPTGTLLHHGHCLQVSTHAGVPHTHGCSLLLTHSPAEGSLLGPPALGEALVWVLNGVWVLRGAMNAPCSIESSLTPRMCHWCTVQECPCVLTAEVLRKLRNSSADLQAAPHLLGTRGPPLALDQELPPGSTIHSACTSW